VAGVTPQLTVVVVHHRTPEILEACLERLGRCAPPVRCVVVDTAPDDAVLEAVRERHPDVTVVTALNHSYAHAVNVGLKLADGAFVAHMNADVYVEPVTFARLVEALERHPDAGVAAPLARTPRGRRQDHGLLYHPHYLRLGRRPGGSVRVPWLTGCLQVVRRSVLDRVGGLDPSLRFYNEDMEFCLRARAAGFRCLLVDVPVLHLGGAATPSAGAFLVEGVRGGYQLSRRYLPAPARLAHRVALAAWGSLGGAFGRGSERRRTLRRIGAMARSGCFDDSPFGDTLQDLDGSHGLRP
jgi:GT2 family glycosyltransferase